jgi:hypothetical protein
MKKWIILVVALLLTGGWTAELLAASVRGYTRRDGTYVQPHQRTAPDGNPYNNYGYPGNYNPNTGRVTPGDQGRYLDQYYGTPGGSGGFGTLPSPYGR